MKLDEIGFWSEIKLEIIKKYAKAYSIILSNQKGFNHYYVDAFSGAGEHISRESGDKVLGSAVNALNIVPPFRHYYFIDTNSQKTDYLQNAVGERTDVTIYNADSNKILIDKIFREICWDKKERVLCLLDPYGLDLNWEVIQTAGESNIIEIFLNFPVLDMQRNVFWKNPKGDDDPQVIRMNKLWGDNSWRNIVYTTERDLFGEQTIIKNDARTISLSFKKRLKNIAGFKFVPDPIPMRNKTKGLMYYLYFASPNPIGNKIVTDIFDSYRRKGWN